eukprot:TRINITY_DN1310_c0_g1_i4.p1 TRINITY_DN1310_c0_g1~~TRINITY_DN1310_c0_g1_i4.p1  ORF type:complete len:135 (-),score=11.47 TRINITY_DN1310_c0_g1_i4:474-878(-)
MHQTSFLITFSFFFYYSFSSLFFLSFLYPYHTNKNSGTQQVKRGTLSSIFNNPFTSLRYRSITPMYYRGAQAAILVFDVTNIESFENAQSWIEGSVLFFIFSSSSIFSLFSFSLPSFPLFILFLVFYFLPLLTI